MSPRENMRERWARNESHWDARTIAACSKCHCGYISVNYRKTPKPACIACGGLVLPLEQIRGRHIPNRPTP